MTLFSYWNAHCKNIKQEDRFFSDIEYLISFVIIQTTGANNAILNLLLASKMAFTVWSEKLMIPVP